MIFRSSSGCASLPLHKCEGLRGDGQTTVQIGLDRVPLSHYVEVDVGSAAAKLAAELTEEPASEPHGGSQEPACWPRRPSSMASTPAAVVVAKPTPGLHLKHSHNFGIEKLFHHGKELDMEKTLLEQGVFRTPTLLNFE